MTRRYRPVAVWPRASLFQHEMSLGDGIVISWITGASFASLLTPSAGSGAPGPGDSKSWEPDLDDPGRTLMEPSYAAGCAGAIPVTFNAVTEPAHMGWTGYQAWFTFTALEGDLLTLGTLPARDGEDTDTFLALVADDCRTFLSEDDDDGPGRHGLIYRLAAPYTGQYFLQVRGYRPEERGSYRAYFTRSKATTILINDRCEGAVALPRCREIAIHGDLRNAESPCMLCGTADRITGMEEMSPSRAARRTCRQQGSWR